MTVGWAQVAVGLISAIGAMVAALWANKSRLEAAEARDLAREISEDMAEAQRQIAAALEKPVVEFVIEPDHKCVVLRNVGTGTATGVVVEWPEGTHILSDQLDTMPNGVGMRFIAPTGRFDGQDPTHLVVRCNELAQPAHPALPLRRL